MGNGLLENIRNKMFRKIKRLTKFFKNKSLIKILMTNQKT